MTMTIPSLTGASSVPRAFTPLTGHYLDGRVARNPADFAHKPALVIVDKALATHDDARRWALWAVKQYGVDGRIFVRVIVLIDSPAALTGVFESMLRAETPTRLQPVTMTIADPDHRIRKQISSARERSADVYLLDRQAKVRWEFHEGYTDQNVLGLQHRVEDHGFLKPVKKN